VSDSQLITELIYGQVALALLVFVITIIFGATTPLIMAGGISIGLWLAAGWVWMRDV
jgi:hypothetical protein